MTFVALWSPALPTGGGHAAGTVAEPATSSESRDRLDALCEALLTMVPHVVVESRPNGMLVWADARGLPGRRVAADALQAVRRLGVDEARIGVARIAIAAEVAARYGVCDARAAGSASRAPVTVVAPGYERRFLAPHPLAVLPAAPEMSRTLDTFADVGLETCGCLARLTHEAVEVRFGLDGLVLWRLARADDPRTIFRHPPWELPTASLEWEEYALRDAARLVFVANRLMDRVCAELHDRGVAARAMTLTLALAGGGMVEHPVRAARGTADRAIWLRLVRAALERAELPDAARGLALRVDAVHQADPPQGDLFDRGFQTAEVAEATVARLVEDGSAMPVQPELSAHALPEQRARWQAMDCHEVASAVLRTLRRPHHDGRARLTSGGRSKAASSAVPTREPTEPLALRLLPEPRPIAVITRDRRGHIVPVRYRERLADGARAPRGLPLIEIVTAVGPDRIAAGHEAGLPVVREYWQCLTSDGGFVLLFRDAARGDAGDGTKRESPDDARGVWHLHGWWD